MRVVERLLLPLIISSMIRAFDLVLKSLVLMMLPILVLVVIEGSLVLIGTICSHNSGIPTHLIFD
jgi:hypothetical protein